MAPPHPYPVPKMACAGLAVCTGKQITYWRGQSLQLKVLDLNLNSAISYLCGLLGQPPFLPPFLSVPSLPSFDCIYGMLSLNQEFAWEQEESA